MRGRRSIDEAVSLLHVELQAGQRAITDLTTEDAWLAFIRFGRQRFDTADTPDADGLLYQYGALHTACQAVHQHVLALGRPWSAASARKFAKCHRRYWAEDH